MRKRLAKTPLWLLIPFLFLGGARLYVIVDRLTSGDRSPKQTCLAQKPQRVEYLSTAGEWSPTSVPDSIRSSVYVIGPNSQARSPDGTGELRSIEPPPGWVLSNATPAQRTALEPFAIGDTFVSILPPETCR